MNIVMVGGFALYPKGTMSARALPLAQALVRRHHRVTLVLPPWDHPQDAGRRLNLDGVEVVNTPLPRNIPGWWHAALTSYLVRHTLALKPQVVHIFKPKGFSGLTALALYAQRKMGRLHARIVIDADDWEGAGGWNQLGGYNPLERAFFAWQERWLLSHADAVITASRPLLERALELRQGRHDVYYLPNGAVISALDPGNRKMLRRQLGFDDSPVVLWFTRFMEAPPKWVMNLFQAIERRFPNIRFLVVGAGLRGEEALFQTALVQTRPAPKVVQTGWVEPEKLAGYLSVADVAIYPLADTLVNRARCPAKLALLLGHGLPVVASDVGQAKEYIIHGESGFLVSPDSEGAFAEVVTALLGNPSLRKRLADGAQKRMRDFFSWDILADQALRAYGA